MTKSLPKEPVILKFRPEMCDNLAIVAVFADNLARQVWLMIAPGHLMGPDFVSFCMAFANRVRKKRPSNEMELYRELQLWDQGREFFNKLFEEVEIFLSRFLDALNGGRPIRYKVILPDTSEDRRYKRTLRRRGLHDGILGKDPSSYNHSYRRGFMRGARINRQIRETPKPVIRYA